MNRDVEVFKLPKRFEDKLDKTNKATVTDIIDRLGDVYIENKLEFFDEYTDHGWRHINAVLNAADSLIPDDTFELLTSNDILLLVASVFLHDVGMHTPLPVFRELVDTRNDKPLIPALDKTPWPVLWSEYLDEARKFSSAKREQIFGNESVDIKLPDLNHGDTLNGIQKKLIGEFIRRHHPRMAHEMAVKGLVVSKSETVNFFRSSVDKELKDLCGLLARSHGMEIRDLSKYLTDKYSKAWKKPYGTHIHHLMVVLRMADYFQIDASRVLKVPYETREFQSPISRSEHLKHLQTKYAEPLPDDPETMFIHALPESSTYFVGLSKLFKAMQRELDTSWAVLGEMYGTQPYDKQPRINCRRITSNIFDTNFAAQVDYVPDEIHFTIDREISKLLIAPLYGDNPTYGVRELIQNAVDACLERQKIEGEGSSYDPFIEVKLYSKDGSFFFCVSDNGKGMSIDEIKKHFLTVGSSYRKSTDWYKKFVDKGNKSTVRRSGRFGIGVLAAYLLGRVIEVQTRSYKDETGYAFNTNLEQSQIDVKKEVLMPVGSCVKIAISESVYNALKPNFPKKGYSIKHTGGEIGFYQWYCLSSPKICYQIDNVNIEMVDLFTFNYSEKWNNVKVEEYNEVMWRYENGYSDLNKLYCNGIYIPDTYSVNDDFVKYMPVLCISDYDARMPLNLNRNKLSGRLELDKELIADISRSIIWGLLNFRSGAVQVDDDLILGNKESFRHPAFIGERGHQGLQNEILYTNDGFTLIDKLFLSRLKDYTLLQAIYHYEAMSFGAQPKPDKVRVKLMPHCLLQIIKTPASISQIPDYTDYINNRDKYYWGRMEDLKYIFPFHESYPSLTLSGVGYTSYSPPKEFDDIFKQMKANMLIVSDIKWMLDKRVLGQLVDYYLDGDPVIPYKMEDRKKKFSKAFKELSKYPLYA